MTAVQQKGKQRYKQSKPKGSRGQTVTLANERLESIWCYVDDENKGMGEVAFVSSSKKKPPIKTKLFHCSLPVGLWEVQLSKRENVAFDWLRPITKEWEIVFDGDTFRLHSETMPIEHYRVAQGIIDKALEKTVEIDGGEVGVSFLLYGWKEEAAKDKERYDLLYSRSEGHKVRISVVYSRTGEGNFNKEEGKKVYTLTDQHKQVLSSPEVATILLEFVEHFGKTPVDYSMAVDGISEQELIQLQTGPKGTKVELIELINGFCQGYHEFSEKSQRVSPPVDLENFRAMLEAIFLQKERANDLALRNQLMIGTGYRFAATQDGKKKSIDDIGVLNRTQGEGKALMYDRYGMAVRDILGNYAYEHININLADLGISMIEILPEGVARFINNVRQSLGVTMAEESVLTAIYVYKYLDHIAELICEDWGDEIAERIWEMSKTLIFFFILQSVVIQFARTGHPVGIALAVLLQVYGVIAGIEFGLEAIEQFAVAGQHFSRLALISLDEEETKSEDSEYFSRLSEGHLEKGTEALINALVEVIGTYAFAKMIKFGVKTIQTSSLKQKTQVEKDQVIGQIKAAIDRPHLKIDETHPFSKMLKRDPKDPNARFEMLFEDGRMVGIKPLKGQTKVEVTVYPEGYAFGIGEKISKRKNVLVDVGNGTLYSGKGRRKKLRETKKIRKRIRKLIKKKMRQKYENESIDEKIWKGYLVEYVRGVKRLDYQLVIRNGKLVHQKTGKPFDTKPSRKGKAIFVIDNKGNIYAYNHPDAGVFHHSSFVAGRPVAFAGEFTVNDGRLVFMNRQSGHYYPTMAMLKRAVKYMSEIGIDMKSVKIDSRSNTR